MKINFGSGSWAETEICSWEIYYPWPVTYNNEPGLAIHLSENDAQDIVNVISTAAAAVGTAVGGVFGPLAGALPELLVKFFSNSDGSIVFHIAPHAIEINDAPAFDPNVINPAWSAVASALFGLFHADSDLEKINSNNLSSGKMIDRRAFELNIQ
jgi:hypothetical protein